MTAACAIFFTQAGIESGMKIGQEIYAKQQADEAAAQAAPAQDDVVDAEIVDEDDK